MYTQPVTVSGTVGKQVFSRSTASAKVVLKGFLLAALSANSRVTIRDGGSGASGTVVFEQSVLANHSAPVILTKEGQHFGRGMHVTVLGSGAICYLFID